MVNINFILLDMLYIDENKVSLKWNKIKGVNDTSNETRLLDENTGAENKFISIKEIE